MTLSQWFSRSEKTKAPKIDKEKLWSIGFEAGYLAALRDRPILTDSVMQVIREQAADEAIKRLHGNS